MEWIDQLQQTFGRPVIGFARENWVYLLAIITVVTWCLFNIGAGHDLGTGSDEIEDGGADGGGD